MPAAAPMDPEARRILLQGVVIPAHPLALNSHRKLDERRQRALTRYYCESGAGGLAVGVHTTQFAIRDPRIGLFDPVLKLAVETARECEQADRKSTRLNSSHSQISYAVFCLKKKKNICHIYS